VNEEELLRRVLDREASTVEVRPDALAEIRARTARRRNPLRRWFPALAVGVATAAAVGVVAATLSPPTAAPPDQPPAATGPAVASPAAPARTVLPVYYLGRGDRLYREYHPLDAGGGTAADQVRAAVAELMRDSAADPDYRTAWPAGVAVDDVRVDGDTVTVSLTGLTGLTGAPKPPAVRQLVWTVTAVSQLPGVRVVVDGGPLAGFGGRLVRGPALDELADLWLIEPQEGSVVGPTPTVHVDGAVFEATVQLRVRAGDRVVQESVATLSEGAPRRGEARVKLAPLAPGDYTVEAYVSSPEDGRELYLDGHDITVR
jgi:sporulation and spore germination protein/immunoglobulin-like protein involved in spore germination